MKKIITEMKNESNETTKVVEFFEIKGVKYPIKSINGAGGGSTFKSGESVFEVELVGRKSHSKVERLYSSSYIDSVLKGIKEEMDNTKTDIKDLKQQITDRELPIGTVIIATEAPTYGVWINHGLIDKGQTIVGGWTTNGAVQKHEHEYWRADMTPEMAVKSGSDTRGVTWGASQVIDNPGDDKNRAWGRGFGNDKILFIRES